VACQLVIQRAIAAGALEAILCDYHARGGAGAVDLAMAVCRATTSAQESKCSENIPRTVNEEHFKNSHSRAALSSSSFQFLYDSMTASSHPVASMNTIVQTMYGGTGVALSSRAAAQLDRYEGLIDIDRSILISLYAVA
jgi:formyltetrahydrofolate synthetase